VKWEEELPALNKERGCPSCFVTNGNTFMYVLGGFISNNFNRIQVKTIERLDLT
tara:strand:+ start:669 stop:830 length:162 start_codon:yes stop_codon:yes gene_type:complete